MKIIITVGIILSLLIVTVPAIAKVTLSGIIFTDLYYLDRSKNDYFNPTRNTPHAAPYTNTAIQLPDITRFTFRWVNEDNVGMRIQFGLGQKSGTIENSEDNNVKLLHAYGWWDMTPKIQLLAGKTTTPFSPLNPSQLLGATSGSLNCIGHGYGDFYSGRFAQLRGTYRFNKDVRIAVALVDPNGVLSGGSGDLHPATSGTDNTTIPRIDVSVPIYLGPLRIYPGFCYQHRSYDNSTYTNISGKTYSIDNNITSYIGSIGSKLSVGAFVLSAEGNWGKNWANMRGNAGNSPSVSWDIDPRPDKKSPISGAVVDQNYAIHDAETYSFWFDVSFKFGPVTPHLIYGQQQSTNVMMGTNIKVQSKTQMYGVSIPIILTKGFSIRPEFMWYNDGAGETEGQSNQDFGHYGIYGVQFQITF